MRNFLIGLLVFALVPATVFAGGGGAKPTSFIKVRNGSGEQLAVIVDPPAVIPTNLDAFRAAGGKLLNTGETASFNVKEGSHTVAAAYINAQAQAPGATGTRTISVGKSRTVNITATGSSAAAPVLTIN
jgi:hypothetical protein